MAASITAQHAHLLKRVEFNSWAGSMSRASRMSLSSFFSNPLHSWHKSSLSAIAYPR
jgi:hypothetical protein